MKVKELSEMTLQELWQLFPIVLTKHNSLWCEWYKEELDTLTKELSGITIYRISHIGSTAIDNIWAKPTIDILIEVADRHDMKAVKEQLIKYNYICMSEDGAQIALNKGYTKYGYAERVFHIHIRIAGDNDELYFRDYMNDNKQLAKEYEKLKLSLWKKYEHDRDGYTFAKSDFIKSHTAKAKLLYLDRYAVKKEASTNKN